MGRIRWIEIQGFRSFGQVPQRLEFSSDSAVIWGTNSQGKTSLAKAIEFLLTGETVRRKMLASAQDEFAESLRNVHMPPSVKVYVSANIGDEVASHIIKRTLTSDYTKKNSCRSELTIDGTAASEDDLKSVGVRLSEPPLSAPVLMQHTLAYLFSVGPQDRSVYFKALLEISDLDEIRTQISNLENSVAPPNNLLVAKLARCQNDTDLASSLSPLTTIVSKVPDVETHLFRAVTALLSANGVDVPESATERYKVLKIELGNRRKQTFPVDGFSKQSLPSFADVNESVWSDVDDYCQQLVLIDAETRRLISFFEELLKISHASAISTPVDCPACGTEATLTPERIDYVRTKVSDAGAYAKSKSAAIGAINVLESQIISTDNAVQDALPVFLDWSEDTLTQKGFSQDKLFALLGNSSDEELQRWNLVATELEAAADQFSKLSASTRKFFSRFRQDMSLLTEQKPLKDEFAKVAAGYKTVTEKLTAYDDIANPLVAQLNDVIDAQLNTTTWNELLELCGKTQELRTGLVEQQASSALTKELAKAIKEFDKAKEKVFEEKFAKLSEEIRRWWDMLRPDEPTFFESVKPRPGARRTVDFKAGLSRHNDQSDSKLRDAISVFSQSQIHCLGLAAFLARACREGSRFIILDDPILASDTGHRAFFVANVVKELLTTGHQIIILTQDEGSKKNLAQRYAHQKIDVFELTMEDPGSGTEICKTSDDLALMLHEVKPFVAREQVCHRRQAAEQLRNAGERFCKKLLLKERLINGEVNAMLTDYDGKDFGTLITEATPLLVKSPADVGKLQMVRQNTNSGKHDHEVPQRSELRVALGDLNRLRRDYLL